MPFKYPDKGGNVVLGKDAFLDNWNKFLGEVFQIGLPAINKIDLPKTHPDFK